MIGIFSLFELCGAEMLMGDQRWLTSLFTFQRPPFRFRYVAFFSSLRSPNQQQFRPILYLFVLSSVYGGPVFDVYSLMLARFEKYCFITWVRGIIHVTNVSGVLLLTRATNAVPCDARQWRNWKMKNRQKAKKIVTEKRRRVLRGKSLLLMCADGASRKTAESVRHHADHASWFW